MKWIIFVTVLLGIILVVTFPRKKQVALMAGPAQGTGNVGQIEISNSLKVTYVRKWDLAEEAAYRDGFSQAIFWYLGLSNKYEITNMYDEMAKRWSAQTNRIPK